MQQSLHHARIHALKHSTWITAIWDWLMELIGRSAEAILVVSVLYQSVKLLPVVHMPASLDVIAFIAQFVALDVGGLSLGKLAKQAQREGNPEGATQAQRMSTCLIFIMIAGVVVVSIEQLFPIPANGKLAIDTTLLIARSILAVLYGHIIHSVKVEKPQELIATSVVQVDIQSLLAWPLVGMAAMQQEQLAMLQATFEQRLANIQHPQDHVPTFDFEALREAITDQIEATSEAKFAAFLRQSEALFEAKMRQHITVSEVPMRRQIEAPKPRREAKYEASKPPQNVVPMRQTALPHTDKRAAVYQLADKDTSASSYEIAEQTGIPVSTVQRYLKERREAESEATGTDQ